MSCLTCPVPASAVALDFATLMEGALTLGKIEGASCSVEVRPGEREIDRRCGAPYDDEVTTYCAALPEILLVSLARSTGHSHGRHEALIETEVRVDVGDTITFTVGIDAPRTWDERYQVKAVVWHTGTLAKGHYVVSRDGVLADCLDVWEGSSPPADGRVWHSSYVLLHRAPEMEVDVEPHDAEDVIVDLLPVPMTADVAQPPRQSRRHRDSASDVLRCVEDAAEEFNFRAALH
jgi:hypothetical protein